MRYSIAVGQIDLYLIVRLHILRVAVALLKERKIRGLGVRVAVHIVPVYNGNGIGKVALIVALDIDRACGIYVPSK